MKKISEYLKVQSIDLDLKSKDKKAILKELFEKLGNCKEVTNKEKCYEDLLEREKLGSTGIGEGFAIPHAKSTGVSELIMTVGISKEPIEYEAVDGKPVNIFFMFLSPNELSQEYLILLAKISRYIRENNFKTQLLNAKKQEDIVQILNSKDE
ncbi:PTS sugar transporter subunit IIA [Sneathia sanguinegens]|uniref:PTS sugar transporter subunit IIA n=1 Tax=Sneathia sanguinegens TaxID=40543 RepID=A0ABT7HJT4_9FUSO|nr:PTS sugar transporter subunit IIA [Sneathia sanguinegens]MDK9580404.1 PTS sugar transporter subunit IIA [Sneathia sanguinegens]